MGWLFIAHRPVLESRVTWFNLNPSMPIWQLSLSHVIGWVGAAVLTKSTLTVSPRMRSFARIGWSWRLTTQTSCKLYSTTHYWRARLTLTIRKTVLWTETLRFRTVQLTWTCDHFSLNNIRTVALCSFDLCMNDYCSTHSFTRVSLVTLRNKSKRAVVWLHSWEFPSFCYSGSTGSSL